MLAGCLKRTIFFKFIQVAMIPLILIGGTSLYFLTKHLSDGLDNNYPGLANIFTILIASIAGAFCLTRLAALKHQSNQEEIRKLNEELEQRVSSRTAQLEAVNRELESQIRQREQAQEEITWLNDDLQRRAIALEAANRELESFSYSVSHDLRAPLRHIEGFSQLLLEECNDRLDQNGKHYLSRVLAASKRMALLIDALLNLSRLSKSKIQRKRINLGKIARDIANELMQTQPERQVTFRINEGVTAIGDPQLVRVVLENLLGNAWKYTGKQEKATIEFGVTDDGDNPAYFVSDDGAGFDMLYAEKLFSPFQRLHGIDEFEGTGIGLATVQRVVLRHGGKVWAEGEIGKGASFYFTL